MCETRRVERHATFEDLANFYELVIHCLESIERNDDPENRFDSKAVIEASGLLKQLQNRGFITSFQICCYIYGYTKGLSKQLQGSLIEIIKTYEMVSLEVDHLSNIRSNDVKEFQPILEKSKDMLKISKIKLEIPRTASRQTLRNNVEHTSIEEYYRRSVFLPLLDSLLQQLNDRFQGKRKDAIKRMYLITSNNEKVMNEKEKIKAYYATDLINNGANLIK